MPMQCQPGWKEVISAEMPTSAAYSSVYAKKKELTAGGYKCGWDFVEAGSGMSPMLVTNGLGVGDRAPGATWVMGQIQVPGILEVLVRYNPDSNKISLNGRVNTENGNSTVGLEAVQNLEQITGIELKII